MRARGRTPTRRRASASVAPFLTALIREETDWMRRLCWCLIALNLVQAILITVLALT